jgi:hypothetical protein
MTEVRKERKTDLGVYCVDDVRADWITNLLRIAYSNSVHLLRLKRLRQRNVI